MASRGIWRHSGFPRSRRVERRVARRGRKPSERLQSERLEPRLAMAADVAVALVDGVVRIEGTSGDDAIFIRQHGDAVAIDYASGLNTTGRVTFPSGVERIEVQGGAGRDLFVLQLGSLAERIIVDTGPQADLLLSDTPVEVRNASGRDLFVPLVDRALPPGSELTSHRIDRPNLTHEAVYIGQSLTTSRSWTADGRLIEITVDGRERIIRSTSLGGHPILQEYWGDEGGYVRIVTGSDGTVLRETFQDGVLQLEERQRGEQLIRTTWDQDGYSFRQSRDGDRLFLEEAWDPQGGYRRAWADESGRFIEEVFEDGILRVKTITKGARHERGAWDTAGNRVREVFVRGVFVRLDQWGTDGVRRTTRYAGGLPASRETFENDRLVQHEAWADGRLVKTAWNETGDRIIRTFVDETLIREEEIRISGERRATEMADGLLIRTMTDTAGNVVEERFLPVVRVDADLNRSPLNQPPTPEQPEQTLDEAFTQADERMLSRRIQAADGSQVLTTFDPESGGLVTEERISADGRQVQITTRSPEAVLRRTLQDGTVVARERWRSGNLRRISTDGSGTTRVEWFTGSDPAALGEGTRVSDTITTPAGYQLKTTWDPDGTRQVTGSRNGTLVFEERHQGSSVTKTMYGSDGGRQDEIKEDGHVRLLIQRTGDGSYRERRFATGRGGGLQYELIRNSLGSFIETTWSRGHGAYGADVVVTELAGDGPGTTGSGNTRMRTYTNTEQEVEERLVWRGGGTMPGSTSTFLKQWKRTTNLFPWWVSPSDIRNEVWFYDQGQLVYHEQTLVNGSTRVLTQKPSAALEQAKQGSLFGLSGSNVFSLVPGGGSFNLFAPVEMFEEWGGKVSNERDKISKAVEPLAEPLERMIGNVAGIFNGIESISRALDVNFQTLLGDLDQIIGSIDFGKFALPGLEAVRFEGIDFKPAIDFKWSPLDVKFASPIAAIDFGKIASGAWNDAKDYATDKAGVISDWLAKVDPFAWVNRKLIVKEVDLETSNLRNRLDPYLEAGYTRDQANLLYDLLDRKENLGGKGFRGRYLAEFNEFLAAEGQKVYQSHLESDGGELDAAGHARLQQIAGQQAQARLLARYGLNPDGTKVAPVREFDPWGFSLRDDDKNDPRFSADGDGFVPDIQGDPIIITPRKPTKERPPRADDSDFPEPPDSTDDAEKERQRREEQERQRRVRIAETRQRIADEFPGAITASVSAKVVVYAGAKGRVVTDFYDSVEQTMRIGGGFAAGLGTGATAAVEGLAKGVMAAFNADTWAGLGNAVRQQGRNFMEAPDKARFIADFGEQTYRSFEDSVVRSIDEWERASPEGRARMLGRIAGQVATEAVVGGVVGRIAGRVADAAQLGRRTKTAVDRTVAAPEFADYERAVKAAAGKDKTNVQNLLKAHDTVAGQSLAKQLRERSGMHPGHASRIAQFAKEREQLIIVRSSNPNSLQWFGKKGHAAKPGDLQVKTNPRTGLVTATRRRDGALIDARGDVVDGLRVEANGWIVNTKTLVNGKPIRTNYRLVKGHIVDAKGTRFYSDYDILSVDEAPLNGPGWQMVSTGDKQTGPGQVIGDLNRAVFGQHRSLDMFKHGANRENFAKSDRGIYQNAMPQVGETFTVFDADGTIFVADQLYVKRLLEGRNIPTDDVLPPLPGDGDWID